jgi:hypothetical protein
VNARDRQLVDRAVRHGRSLGLDVSRAVAHRIIIEARRARVPISWMFALVHQESDFRNIFGCDWGPASGPPYCRQLVTRARVQALLRHGKANGVGLTQLTDFAYVRRAERTSVVRGNRGAHFKANQIRVGAQVLREKTGGDMGQAWKYNGDPGYQRKIAAKQRGWHAALT